MGDIFQRRETTLDARRRMVWDRLLWAGSFGVDQGYAEARKQVDFLFTCIRYAMSTPVTRASIL